MTEDDNFYYSELEGNPSWMTAQNLPLCEDGMMSYEEAAKPFKHRKCVKPVNEIKDYDGMDNSCLLYTSPSPRDLSTSRMPSSA